LSDPLPVAQPEAGSAARRVAKNALSPFAAQLVTRALMLGYGIVQYRVLGGEGGRLLGDYFIAALIFMYVSTIADWGLGTLLTREVAKVRDDKSGADKIGNLFTQTLALRLLISLALFIPVLAFLELSTSYFNLTAEGVWATIILTISLLPGALSASVTALLHAYERMSLPAAIGVATALVNVLLGVGALLLGMGIGGLALAATLSTILTALVFLRVLRRDFRWLGPTRASLRREGAASLLKAGWPLMLNALLVGLFFRADQFIIKATAGQEPGMDAREKQQASTLEVERYQAAYSFLNFVLLITPAVTLALFPRMARHAATDRPRLASEYTFALKVLLILSVPIVALTVWFAPLLITVLTGGKPEYLPESVVVLQILIFFLPFSFVNGVTQYLLIALDLQRLITRVFVAAVVVNLASNLLLVPRFGINGAAVATVLSELVLLGPFLYWTTREIGRVPLVALALKPLVAGAAVGVIALLLQPLAQGWQSGVQGFVLYLGAGVLLLAAYMGALFLLRPFTNEETATLARALLPRRRG
jgi:O-antigen/teichoic acid export membrane protein